MGGDAEADVPFGGCAKGNAGGGGDVRFFDQDVGDLEARLGGGGKLGEDIEGPFDRRTFNPRNFFKGIEVLYIRQMINVLLLRTLNKLKLFFNIFILLL